MLCLTSALCFGQGSSCATAIPITLDGVLQVIAASSSTGTPLVCGNYTGSTPITWFSFTTNAAADCPLLQITALDNQPCEVAFYTGCASTQLNTSSMCLDDGDGLWAPAETYVLSPNTTYYLRVRTTTACNIRIGGQSYNPPNKNCSGALSIGTTARNDNNACHKPGTGVTASQLCAMTIENTAFYRFTVASSGSAIINITNISCDNGSANNSNGFQIGFFQGTCNSLVPINCTSGSGNFVQASTTPLPAGTQVYVAIDGVAGSNCRYSLTGINVQGVLSSDELQNLSVWKARDGNYIRWMSREVGDVVYEVERSPDGQVFSTLGRLPSLNGLQNYNFRDPSPLQRSGYRIRRIDAGGRITYSPVLWAERSGLPALTHIRIQAAGGRMNLNATSNFAGAVHYQVTSMAGVVMMQGMTQSNGSSLQLSRDGFLPSGRYVVVLRKGEMAWSQGFVISER
jgi:hypothetical protein